MNFLGIERWRGFFGSTRWLWTGLAVVTILSLPSLRVGLQMDDYFHQLHFCQDRMIPGEELSSWDLFSFADGNPQHIRRQMNLGVLPWWTYPEIRARFFRPITSLTHQVDAWLWPKTYELMHLHSVLWYLAGLVVIFFLYRRISGPGWVAGLAWILYALDDAHGWPVGWLANRNALLALFFGCSALLCHDRWRRDGCRVGAILGPFFLLCGLLSGEAAVGACAYLFSYALFLERGDWRMRMLSLAPYVTCGLAWLWAYRSMGFGTFGMSLYLDPMRETGSFFLAVVQRAPILLGAQFGFPPAFLYVFLKGIGRWILAGLGFAFSCLALCVIGKILRQPNVRFWMVGMLLAVLPMCATFPHDRLLLFTGLGAMGMVSQLIIAWVGCGSGRDEGRGDQKNRWADAGPKVGRLGGILVWIWIAIHGVLSPFTFSLSVASPRALACHTSVMFRDLPNSSDVFEQDVISINPPLVFFALYYPVVRFLNDQPYPAHHWILASGIQPMEITRDHEASIVLKVEGGFIGAPFDDLFRSQTMPMTKGEIVSLEGLTIRICEVTQDGRPYEVRFEFEKPLQDEQYNWVVYRDWVPTNFVLPCVGCSVSIPAQALNLSRVGMCD